MGEDLSHIWLSCSLNRWRMFVLLCSVVT